MEHECIIGVLWDYEDASLVSLKDLISYIEERKELNCNISSNPLYSQLSLTFKEWSLSQYADKRVKTNLHRFDFCPECGGKINWKKIRSEQHG